MRNRIREFLEDQDDDQQRARIAACALLLALAHADDTFTADERLHIEAVLRRHFDLDEQTARHLMVAADAERLAAADLEEFTTLVRDSFDLGQKTLLAEIMWGLILSDGEIARHEAHLLREISRRLDLEAGYLSAARRRAVGEEE